MHWEKEYGARHKPIDLSNETATAIATGVGETQIGTTIPISSSSLTSSTVSSRISNVSSPMSKLTVGNKNNNIESYSSSAEKKRKEKKRKEKKRCFQKKNNNTTTSTNKKKSRTKSNQKVPLQCPKVIKLDPGTSQKEVTYCDWCRKNKTNHYCLASIKGTGVVVQNAEHVEICGKAMCISCRMKWGPADKFQKYCKDHEAEHNEE